jgi:acyl-CoA synthetase (NDP forming)
MKKSPFVSGFASAPQRTALFCGRRAIDSIQQECPPRDHIKRSLHRMFNPHTVAVIGASYEPQKWGHRVLHSLMSAGFAGRLVPVNPKGGEILGFPVAENVKQIEGEVDLALIITPSPHVMSTLDDCIEKNVGAVFVITAGFSEVDEKGLQTEKEMAARALRGQVAVGGPNGQGITCTQAKLCGQMYPIMPPTGGVSLVTQSGNIGVTLAHMALYHGIGFSKIISAGNEAAATTADYLDYLAEDDDTTVIAVYLEGAADGRHLLAAMQRASAQKPIVVLKSGHTAQGARAAISHTGSLAGSDQVYDAAFRQAGVVRVASLEDLFDTAAVFATQPLPAGKRVGMITVGGGWGVLGADAAEKEGLLLPDLSPEIRAQLDARLPQRWSRSNPIDFAAAGNPEIMIKGVELMLECEAFDSLVVLGSGHPSLAAHFVENSSLGRNAHVRQFIDLMRAADVKEVKAVAAAAAARHKPLIIASDAALSYKEIQNNAVWALRKEGQHVLSIPDRALRVLGHLTRYALWRQRRGESS